MTTLIDLTPKFQKFYSLARDADPDTRWTLWQEHYNFAALPPSPQAREVARRMLDGAWKNYGTLPADLAAEAKRLLRQEQQATARLSTLLGAPVPAHELVAFVGFFEHNPFVAGNALHFPVEMPAAQTAVFLTHELTHLIHQALSGGQGGWTRSLAALIVQEGLATRATDALHPQAPFGWRVGEPDWLQACEAERSELVQDALLLLGHSDDATLLRFLHPHPAGAQERTAYALGWWFAGEWLASGRTLAALARVPEGELPALLRQHWE